MIQLLFAQGKTGSFFSDREHRRRVMVLANCALKFLDKKLCIHFTGVNEAPDFAVKITCAWGYGNQLSGSNVGGHEDFHSGKSIIEGCNACKAVCSLDCPSTKCYTRAAGEDSRHKNSRR